MKTQRFVIGRKAASFVAFTESVLFLLLFSYKPPRDRQALEKTEGELSMDDKVSDEANVCAAAAETEKREKVEPEKELCHGDDDDGLSQLRGEESLTDMEGLHERENLDRDHDEGVRENSSVELQGEDIGEVKERVSDKVENREVETSIGVTASLNPSMVVETSLSSNPSAAHGASLVSVPSKQEQRSDSQVVSNLSEKVLRTAARDGYHWRKYGQKQVKSPKGSRSYYRCTYSECCAKKIECSNDSGNVTEIVNKGLHCHEPFQKNSFSPRETRAASAVSSVSEDSTVAPTSSALSASTKENIGQSLAIVERKRNCENEAVEEPEPKRRQKKCNSQSSDSVSKPGKKHKVVVHTTGDVGISGDGYRWRKYGQKMVKGNPNQRNYYRCTSAGCPVRKHIETAVENKTAIVITYKGVHNHDMPVPKKRHGPPSSVLVAAASPTSMRTRLEDRVNIPTSEECLVGGGSEKQSSERVDVVGGEKVMESARTLLSIGFEIKQC